MRSALVPILALVAAVGATVPARAQFEGVPRDRAPDATEEPAPAPVVMPKLIHFVQAAYPEEAQDQGIEGEVVLKLTIDREGNVTEAEVQEPAGHGFDEPARQAALSFKFDPATRGGEPVPVTILFKYSFHLAPASKEPIPAEPAAPTTGNLGGALEIATSDAPLVGAAVVIRFPDGTERRVQSDARGAFHLEGVPQGSYELRVELPGFRPFSAREEVFAGERTDVVYRISPDSSEIEILVEGERPPREVTRRVIERREIDRIPGTSGDALRSIQSLPGVSRAYPFSGELIVRGSAPEETAVFVDGAEVPIIYHFGGLSSVVPTELLDRIDFFPGNFSARYGRVSGGIVDVGLREPDTLCFDDYGKRSQRKGCYHGLAQVDLVDGRLMLQGPIGRSKEWSFALAGRRSWLDAWLKPVLEEAGASVTSAPVYYDYQAIVERREGDSRFSLRAFGSDDRFEAIFTDPAAEDPTFGGNLSFGTRFFRAQALYTDRLSPDVSLSTMLSAGRDHLDFTLGSFLFDFTLDLIGVRSELGFRLAEGMLLNLGMDYEIAPLEFTVRAPEPPRPGEPDPGPFVTRPILETHGDQVEYRPAWYGELELQLTPRLRVVPGVRLDYARDTGHGDFSPRLNARYDLVPGRPESQGPGSGQRRTTLKGGVGIYDQPPNGQQTDEVFGTPGLESNRAVHYSLGVEQEITDQIELSTEGFFKDLENQVARAPVGTRFAYTNDGSGYVVGWESLLKYKPDERFFGWLAYTLSRSVRQDGPDEEPYLFQYDQTHNLIVLGSYRLGRGWEFGARFRLVSGRLDSPVVRSPRLPALYVADAGAYVPLQAEPYSERLPLFHQLDVRVDKRWQFRSWRLSAYLDVQNVYNNQAVEGRVYNYNYSQNQYQTGVPIIPSFGLRGEF